MCLIKIHTVPIFKVMLTFVVNGFPNVSQINSSNTMRSKIFLIKPDIRLLFTKLHSINKKEQIIPDF